MERAHLPWDGGKPIFVTVLHHSSDITHNCMLLLFVAVQHGVTPDLLEAPQRVLTADECAGLNVSTTTENDGQDNPVSYRPLPSQICVFQSESPCMVSHNVLNRS